MPAIVQRHPHSPIARRPDACNRLLHGTRCDPSREETDIP